jgi:hypothetical protein
LGLLELVLHKEPDSLPLFFVLSLGVEIQSSYCSLDIHTAAPPTSVRRFSEQGEGDYFANNRWKRWKLEWLLIEIPSLTYDYSKPNLSELQRQRSAAVLQSCSAAVEKTVLRLEGGGRGGLEANGKREVGG